MPCLASLIVDEDMHTDRVLTQMNNSPVLHTHLSYFTLCGVCSIQLIRHTEWPQEHSQSTQSLTQGKPNEHTSGKGNNLE